MRKYVALLAVVLCTLWYATPAAADGQVVTNGGFETGDFTGWSVSGQTIFAGVDNFDAYSGAYGAYLGGTGGTVTLSQTLSADYAGDSLVVSFALGENIDGIPTSGSNDTMVVTLGGTTLLNLNNPTVDAGQYLVYTFDLVAPSTSFVLSFTAENDDDYWSLDNASVIAPEPQTLLLIGPALAGLAFLRRRVSA